MFNNFCRMTTKKTPKLRFTGPLASYQICEIAGSASAWNAGNVFRHRLQRKLLVSDPGMHHGTCLTHVPRCMSGSLIRGGGENINGIPGGCATGNFTHLAEAHCEGWVIPFTNSVIFKMFSCHDVIIWCLFSGNRSCNNESSTSMYGININ